MLSKSKNTRPMHFYFYHTNEKSHEKQATSFLFPKQRLLAAAVAFIRYQNAVDQEAFMPLWSYCPIDCRLQRKVSIPLVINSFHLTSYLSFS